jgi:hypothetical protein
MSTMGSIRRTGNECDSETSQEVFQLLGANLRQADEQI